MKKQFFLAVIGILLVALLFLFGKTSENRQLVEATPDKPGFSSFKVAHLISDEKKKLTPAQSLYLTNLENSIVRGDVHAQKLTAYNALAEFWKDSINLFEPYAYYTSEAAKLDNSEKSLTFAAQLFLNNLRGEHDEAKLNWEANEAISLFERAIEKNPKNDDLKIGLGSCYVYGKGHNGDPQETMKGIQQLLAVVRKDSNNMKAQMVLGVGGFLSGQYDKAIERLQKVINHEPDNLEAIAFLADTYASKGDREQAVKWYNISKRLANNPDYSKAVNERIKLLK